MEDENDHRKESSATQLAMQILVAPLQGKNHILFMDNFYTCTSIPFFYFLYKLAICCCGTKRTNRKGFSPHVAMKKSEESVHVLKKKLDMHNMLVGLLLGHFASSLGLTHCPPSIIGPLQGKWSLDIVEKSRKPSSMEYGTSVGAYSSRIRNICRDNSR